MSHSQVWMILKADSVSSMLYTAAVILAVALAAYNIIVFLVWVFDQKRLKKGVKKINVLLLSFCLFCSVSFTLFPTTRELVKIHVIPVLLSTKSVAELKKLPPKLLKLLNVGADTLADFIKPKGK